MGNQEAIEVLRCFFFKKPTIRLNNLLYEMAVKGDGRRMFTLQKDD